jgi:PadR family transcriptional regulator
VAPANYPGEFEQMVLLAVLRLGEEAFAPAVLRELDRTVNRRVSRGALYKTLERMETKGRVELRVEATTPDRGGHPRRRQCITSGNPRLTSPIRRMIGCSLLVKD